MKYLTDDTRITGMEEVVAPDELLSEIPITDQVSELVFSNRKAISKMLSGEDPRLLVETPAEVLVGGIDPETMVGRHGEDRDEDHGQRAQHDDAGGEGQPVAAVGPLAGIFSFHT